MKKESFAKYLQYLGFFILAFIFTWEFFLAPRILKLPPDFTYEADVQSLDNFYDESAGQFEGEKPSKTKFWYAADGYENNALKVWNYFEVRKLNGEKIFKAQRLYNVDPLTGRHVKGKDIPDRSGYLFAPRHLHKNDFTYWHINYNAPAHMVFEGVERLFDLKVYRYDCYYKADQTESLAYLPLVPEQRGIQAEVYLTLWIEPVSGRMVKYTDKATAYYYDIKTGTRMVPWNRFGNTFSDLSVAYQVELAKYEKYKIIFVEQIVPLFFLFLVVLLFWGANKAALSKAPDPEADIRDLRQKISSYKRQSKPILKSVNLPLVIFAVTALISLAVWNYFMKYTQDRTYSKFQLETSKLESTILERMGIYINVLRSGRGLIAASDYVSRSEWKAFYSSLMLDKNYPGFQGFGFAKYVLRDEKESYLNEIRREGFPEFKISPEGDRDIYVPVTYLEPFAGKNLKAFGYDWYSEKIRREALEQARDSGHSQLSGKIVLVQEEDEEVKQAGALMLVPIYKKDTPIDTVEQRRKAILGYVYSPFRINDLMAGILGSNDPDFGFMIFDGNQNELTKDNLLFDSSGQGEFIINNPEQQKSRFTRSKTIIIANHPWTLYFYSRPGFGLGPLESRFPFIVLWVGLVFGVLLAALFFALTYSRYKAIDIAEEMTRDLRQRTEENEGIRMQLELTLADIRAEQAKSKVLSERIEIATRSAKMGVWEWDIENNLKIWDDQMLNLYGIKREDFNGSYGVWENIVHPFDRERLKNELKMAVDGIKDYDTEFKIICPGGQVRYIKGRALVQRDSSGKAVRMIGVNWDTTGRHQAEQLVRDQKYALDQSSIVAITDVKGDIIYANDKFCEISQYNREELIGQNHRILKSDEHPPEFFRDMWRTIAQGKVWQGEVKNKKKDGSFYWVHATIVPFLNEDGKPFQYMAIRYDITEMKESQRRLVEATEVKSKFVSIVSHELRTPMAAIKEGISLVVDGSLGDLNEKQKQFLELSRRNVERLSRLINDVLDFQKMQSNTLEMDFSKQDLNGIIREVHSVMAGFIAKKPITFELQLQEDLPQVILDRDKIIQVLTNLVNNAIRNTDHGSIMIVSFLKDQNVIVEVRDSGIGIKDENMARLFTSFQQFGDESRRTGGTGLGLVICKEIIFRHNGRIWVESEWEKGSGFFFSLPIS